MISTIFRFGMAPSFSFAFCIYFLPSCFSTKAEIYTLSTTAIMIAGASKYHFLPPPKRQRIETKAKSKKYLVVLSVITSFVAILNCQ